MECNCFVSHFTPNLPHSTTSLISSLFPAQNLPDVKGKESENRKEKEKLTGWKKGFGHREIEENIAIRIHYYTMNCTRWQSTQLLLDTVDLYWIQYQVSSHSMCRLQQEAKTWMIIPYSSSVHYRASQQAYKEHRDWTCGNRYFYTTSKIQNILIHLS